jgi:phosphopantothenoylcysteine decarboxylase/phosphopantothenate--cysteine ligase
MKNILLGITSGIACYKALDITSQLTKKGYNVTVMMSDNAKNLISPSLFQVISKNKVYYENFEKDEIDVYHIELIKNNDLVVIIPATLNIIGKLSNGIADDFISTCLSASDPNKTLIFPAMNTRMYTNPLNQYNMNKLKDFGYDIIEADTGFLACGENGIGKLPNIDKIIDYIEYRINKNENLKNKSILITAGGTKEPIDPVRTITNNSSGKMGISLAKEAKLMGANVTLISTKKDINIPSYIDKIIYVETTQEMFEAVNNEKDKMDAIIMAAAVSDFKIKNYSNQKIKKKDMNNDLKLELELNKDILIELSKNKNRKYLLVGFAAESQNLIENARLKLEKKDLDFIIANDISDKTIGFNSDYNKVCIIDKNLNEYEIKYNTKDIISKEILKTIFKI